MSARRADTKSYVVVAEHPVDLPDGRSASRYDAVDLTEAQAAGLLADGHLVPADPAPAEKEQ